MAVKTHKTTLPPLAEYVSKQIDALSGHKKQAEIAKDAGFEQPNMMSMIKTGKTRLALNRVPSLAKAINVDPIYLMRIWFHEYEPEILEFIERMIRLMSTDNEVAIINFIREVSGDTNPALDDGRREDLRKTFGH